MMKPRILVSIHYMEIGGAEISLIGLLNALDYTLVDVDLFIYDHRGELMGLIPEQVNILPQIGAYAMTERPMSQLARRGYPGVLFGRTLGKVLNKWLRIRKPLPPGKDDESAYQYMDRYTTSFLPLISKDEYDLAINFCGMNSVILHKAKAKKKITWLHTDYSTVSLNSRMALKIWSKYDNIISISENVTASFLSEYPSLVSKIVEIENILSTDFVRNRAEEFDASNELVGRVNLLSVGRFCTQKNYDNVPDMARRMIEAGVEGLKWYIIGFGGDEDLIRAKIKKAGMEQHVIILGKKENPYPYIKACDIYVQPSRYEGKSVTVREAQMLCKPVAITAYPTASSQIKDGVDGVIVPLDNDGCAKGLTGFINNTKLQSEIKEYLAEHDYSNSSEVNKIYKLLNIK